MLLVALPTRMSMAFTGAHHANLLDPTFNDIGQNQYNVQITNISSPHISRAFSAAQVISSMVAHVEIDREQLKALSSCINTLLRTISREYSAGRLLESTVSAALEELNKFVQNCHM